MAYTKEIKEEIRKEMMNLLREYDYPNNDTACTKIIKDVEEQKSRILALMEKSPFYNGKGQIVLSASFERKADEELVEQFTTYTNNVYKEIIKQDKILGYWTVKELDDIRNSYLEQYSNAPLGSITALEAHNWYRHYNKLRNRWGFDENGKVYDYTKKLTFEKICDCLCADNDSLVSEDVENRLSGLCPELKVRAGQKKSKVFNKLCKMLGIDKDKEYNREFAKFADAINPLKVTKWTVISVNPIDYLTMSFGRGWASCHTIDKENKRHSPNNYEGAYSNGTMSYALDNYSVIVYTIESSYDGTEWELQDKINRCVFQITDDFIVQGRVYPQDNDQNGKVLYDELRNIIQRVFAGLMNVPNFWELKKGTTACRNYVWHTGINYPDYHYFENCNVSVLKERGNLEISKINVGASQTTCPGCGATHERQDNICCFSCVDDGSTVECFCCGERLSEDDIYWCDDDNPYCYDCSDYCSCCDNRVPNDDLRFVDNQDRYVCTWCLESYSEFCRCNGCREWMSSEDGIEDDSNGDQYCGKYCAERNGVHYTGFGTYTSNTCRCSICNNWIDLGNEDWNDTTETCAECSVEEKED